MNNKRRKQIDKAMSDLESIRNVYTAFRAAVDDLQEAIESVQSDEREYFDNMPESLQGGDKGQAAEAACDKLQEAIDELDGMPEQDFIDTMITALDEAKS